MHLLVLEDEADTSTSLTLLLEGAGHTVLVASDGAKGLELVVKNGFDGAIVDLMMPGTNGWEFLDAVDKAGLRMPVIVVSGYVDIEPPLQHKQVPIMRKPYDPVQLLALVQKEFA